MAAWSVTWYYEYNMDKHVIDRLIKRPANANKYDFGHVLILGGSTGMVGAPLLAGEAALRVGAGLVTIASDKQTTQSLAGRVPEIMTFELPAFTATEKGMGVVLDFMQTRHVSVVVMGPGLAPNAAAIVRALAQKITLPLVIDAGGLAALTNNLKTLQRAAEHNPNIVITPHAGEFARLVGADLPEHNLAILAKNFAKQYGITLVLKGNRTLVAHPKDHAYHNTTGNPGLATAGTGDVLSGVIGGLLAQHVGPKLATETGVFLHGLAGDLAMRSKTEAGMVASDVINFLPQAIKQAST